VQLDNLVIMVNSPLTFMSTGNKFSFMKLNIWFIDFIGHVKWCIWTSVWRWNSARKLTMLSVDISLLRVRYTNYLMLIMLCGVFISWPPGNGLCFSTVLFLDNVSEPSINGLPQNVHTSLVWGQALKLFLKNFFSNT